MVSIHSSRQCAVIVKRRMDTKRLSRSRWEKGRSNAAVKLLKRRGCGSDGCDSQRFNDEVGGNNANAPSVRCLLSSASQPTDESSTVQQCTVRLLHSPHFLVLFCFVSFRFVPFLSFFAAVRKVKSGCRVEIDAGTYGTEFPARRAHTDIDVSQAHKVEFKKKKGKRKLQQFLCAVQNPPSDPAINVTALEDARCLVTRGRCIRATGCSCLSLL